MMDDSILIVDEEEEFRESLKVILESHYQVFTAESNKEALDIIENYSINIVLLSFDASDAKVWNLLKWQKRSTKILMLS